MFLVFLSLKILHLYMELYNETMRVGISFPKFERINI